MTGLTGSYKSKPDSSSDARSTSLDDYAHLVNSFAVRPDQIGSSSQNSAVNVPDEEKLGADLTVFLSNMSKVDTERKRQIQAATTGHNTVSYMLELESDGSDFHTIFKN